MTEALRVRVTVQDTWDTVPLELPPSASIAEVKLRALVASNIARDPSEYLVKYRGATLRDEGASLDAAAVADNAALIVLPARRRPVK